MSSYSITRQHAEQVAEKFLRQQFSVIQVERSILEEEDRVWAVEISTLSFNNQRTIKVKVNAMTGSILGVQ